MKGKSVRQKTCKRCHFTYRGENEIRFAFRPTGNIVANRGSQQLRPVCEFCELERRTPPDEQTRWRQKVERTRRYHAKRLVKSVGELIERYGWETEIMAHQGQHAYDNSCSECFHPYCEMGNGLADITLDIWDRRLDPDYGANTRWMCITCNQAKGTLFPEDWAIKKRLWRLRERFLEEHKDDSWFGLPLFQGRNVGVISIRTNRNKRALRKSPVLDGDFEQLALLEVGE